MSKSILLSCAGRRHYLATYFLQAIGRSGKLVGIDVDPTAPALRACQVARQVPRVFEPHYLNELKQVIAEEKVSMVFSLNDLEVRLLAENRELLEQETGATFYVPSIQTLEVCADKWRTFSFARTMDIPTPETFLTVDDAIAALECGRVHFPLIVKPRWGSASIGLYEVETLADLRSSFENCKQTVAKSLLSSLGINDCVIIQEVIKGVEYGVDVLFGRKENFIGFTAKKKIAMRAGETDKAVTVSPEPLKETLMRIVAALPHRGNMDCDFIERGGSFYLLEFNPRFGGGYPFTHLAGANHVQMLLDDYQGNPLREYRYSIGKVFAKFDSLVEVPHG